MGDCVSFRRKHVALVCVFIFSGVIAAWLLRRSGEGIGAPPAPTPSIPKGAENEGVPGNGPEKPSAGEQETRATPLECCPGIGESDDDIATACCNALRTPSHSLGPRRRHMWAIAQGAVCPATPSASRRLRLAQRILNCESNEANGPSTSSGHYDAEGDDLPGIGGRSDDDGPRSALPVRTHVNSPHRG